MTGIPFVKDLEFEYGQPSQVSRLVTRVIAKNPGPFTYTGTGVYIIGHQNCAVIDPGPDIPVHFEALKSALEGRNVTHVLVTHTHIDHSPLAHPLAQWAGCKVWAGGPAIPSSTDVAMEEGDDLAFKPHETLTDGQVIKGEDWTIEAIATPGHTSSHFCFGLAEENALFSGDHIMGWSTTVISPPDGHMESYLNSLDKIRARNYTTIWPTHGPQISQTGPFLDAYKAHRVAREHAILDRLAAGDKLIPDMVKVIYKDVDKNLHPAACRSVLAHMIHLVEKGKIAANDQNPGLASSFTPIVAP